MKTKKVAIIGSDGFFAEYGGWDQLINNFGLLGDSKINYYIVHPKNSLIKYSCSGLSLFSSPFKGRSFQGMLLDSWSIIFCLIRQCDTFLLLGTKSFPLALFFKRLLFWKDIKIIVNTAGVEWKRPQFSFITKLYIKFTYRLTLNYADHIVIDNEWYITELKSFFKTSLKKPNIISYGAKIDSTLKIDGTFLEKYPFMNDQYFLSVGRAIPDNNIQEICNTFDQDSLRQNKLVLISNFSSSQYGKDIFSRYHGVKNLFLIDGLYIKSYLDLIRRNCLAYIHTHTLCGSAPSLIEMIALNKPIISIDRPQNRFTLSQGGAFFNDFTELKILLERGHNGFEEFRPGIELKDRYTWSSTISAYEQLIKAH